MASWNNDNYAAGDSDRRVVEVRDGVEPYWRELAEGETFAEAIEEFAEGYDFGGWDGQTGGDTIRCRAWLYGPDGEELDYTTFGIDSRHEVTT